MEATSNKIDFHYLDTSFSFPKKTQLKNFILYLLKKEGKAVSYINYIFCKDEYLLQVNKQYLNHSTYTDIITFELSKKGQPLMADIFISIERVRENAQLFKTTFSKELKRVIFHGALHLSGYKDKKAADSKLMREKENLYLGLYVSRETQQARRPKL